MADALRIHPIVVLTSVLVGLRVAGIGGAVFGIPIAAVLSAVFFHAFGGSLRTPEAVAAAAGIEPAELAELVEPDAASASEAPAP